MGQTVHILATVRKPELLDAATLVFSSIRTGFPEATIVVWGNALASVAECAVKRCAEKVGALFRNVTATSHDAWIESLVQRCLEPFWICDTDVVFWGKMSEPKRGVIYSGRFEPEFDEEWSRSRHMARLHTAVMWLDPSEVRNGMRKWMSQFPEPWAHTAEFPFIRQYFVPISTVVNRDEPGQRKAMTLFYDSTAGLWHSIGGTPFTEDENACFDHLHCATYADLVTPHLSVNNMVEAHREIYRAPEKAKGIRSIQDQYYKLRQPASPLTNMVKE